MSQTVKYASLRRIIPSPVFDVKRYFMRKVDLSRSLERIRACGSAATADEAWRMATEYRGYGEFHLIQPIQRKSEICGLLELMRKEKVRSACEIGTMMGGTLFMMTRMLPDDARLFSIDLPSGPDSPGFIPATRKPFHEGFARAAQKVTVIHGDSTSSDTINRFEEISGREPLDFLLIDGDHSFEGIDKDFRNYARFVRHGGLIVLHDTIADEEITERQHGYRFGVPKLWQQLVPHYETEEFIDPETLEMRNGGGIGVIRWDGQMRI